MTWLILGILLWWAAHLFKRAAPAPRAALSARLGEASKGLFAVALLGSVVLMVIGYRSAFTGDAYVPPIWTIHVNNLLMLASVALFGVGSSKSRLRATMRHPMLTGMLVWAVAHLLVNGDWASVILFGGLGAWAVAEMVVINRAEPDYAPWEGGSRAGDIRLVAISLVVFAVISGIHVLLGKWPFPA